MTIKRYSIYISSHAVELRENPHNGDFVRYTDHIAIVAAAYRDAADIADYDDGTRKQWGEDRNQKVADITAKEIMDAILARTPADAQAALTAIERAAYERGVQSALQHIRTWMELEAEDRGEADAEYPLERQCAPILALLTQEGR